jgi:hypothetical protein
MFTTSADGALMLMRRSTRSERTLTRAISPPLLLATKMAFC